LTGGLAKIDAEILACIVSFIKGLKEGLCKLVLRLNLVVPGLNLKDPGSLTITGKEKCRQKQGLQLAA
jgi:hypothetical protein